jgi:hypothetical protein
MPEHSLSSSTRTVELAQLNQINEVLAAPEAPRVTAAELGLTQDPTRPSCGVPAGAVLIHLSFDGPPEYPYIHGRFTASESGGALTVEMHTPALRELSHRLHLHHSWGA